MVRLGLAARSVVVISTRRITDQSISQIKYHFSVRVDVVRVVRVVVLAVRRLCYGVLVPCHAGSAGLG